MLESIREGSQGIVAKIIIGLIILSFALAGVSGYLTGGNQPMAAKVNDVDITLNELERAYQNQRSRMEAQYGDSFGQLLSDSQYLKSFRDGILEQLIGDELLSQFAADSGVRVSDSQIKEAILAMQEFQVDGAFNNDRYIALLQQSGYTPSGFKDYLRIQMSRQQVASAIAASEFSLTNEASQVVSLQQQTRNISYLTVDASTFEASVELSEESKQEYYQTHLEEYGTQEMVALSYVELKLQDLVAKQQVSDEAINVYYQDNIANYQTDPEIRASHILIEFGDDADTAKVKAESLLSQLKDGGDFATLAKAESADTFSAENGGDLDWFGQGVMEPAFDTAAFALENVSDLSEIVQTSFGYHIIKLTGSKPVVTKPLADVATEITEALKTDAATNEFFELQATMAALAFELPDELVELSETLGVEVKTTELLSRTTASFPMNNSKVLNVAFSEELLEEKVNSEVIEVADSHVVVIRVENYEPVRTKSFDEVSEQVVASLTAELAFDAADVWVSEVQSKLLEGEDVSAMLQDKKVEWTDKDAITRFSNDLTANIREQAFKGQLDVVEKITAAKDSISLVRVNQVNQADLSDVANIETMRQRMANASGQRSLQSFIELLKSDAVIERFN